MGATPEQGRHEHDEDCRPQPPPRHIGRASASRTTSGGSAATSTQSRHTRRGGGGDAAGASHSARTGLVIPHDRCARGAAEGAADRRGPRAPPALRRMTTSATATLITQPAPMSTACIAVIGRAEEQHPGQEGEHLRAGAHSDRIGTRHPRAVRAHVAPADRGESEDDGRPPWRAEPDSQDEERRAVGGRDGVEERHPQRGQRRQQAGRGDDPPGEPVPAPPAERRHELQRPEHEEHDRGDDVDDHGDRAVEESRVGGGDGAPLVSSVRRDAPRRRSGPRLRRISPAGRATRGSLRSAAAGADAEAASAVRS